MKKIYFLVLSVFLNCGNLIAQNAAAACPDFTSVSYGILCNGIDICLGYPDADADGIGDGGEDPTGTTMTVATGLATSTAQPPINNGIFLFDADNDGVNDATGFCLTILFDNATCDPEPYTPLVTLVCPDGTPATFDGIEVTDLDILAEIFGVPGGALLYPPLVGIINAPVCPLLSDGTGAVAGNVELFVADALGNPTTTSCLVVEGPVPACDTDNTADPAANAIPIQFNDNGTLLTAAGAPPFACGFNDVADLSSACGACNAPPTCPNFNAVSYGPACNGYDICIGYVDTDMDGIGDGGEDPTGTTMTVATGLATSTAQPPINNGIFPFDSSNDGVDMVDAIGFCLTVLFDNPTCDPEPYTPLVTLLCPDGTPATLDGVEVTDYDILENIFGVVGGTAIYPPLVGIITAPVCPFFSDGTGAVAGNVEVFVADAMGNPTATSCLVVEGPVPACDTDNTADPAANAIPIQFNDNTDPLLIAAGVAAFACGINVEADLSSACDACIDPPTCPNFNAVSYGFLCNGYDICIGYADADMDGIGDNGEDPTGTTLTVTDGLATSTPQAPITDGIIPFDSTNDGVDMIDAIGYCLTVIFDNPTCDPEPFTPMVNLLCPDGTPATLNGVEVTNYDILANNFGVTGGTAIYPPVVGIITAPVCPVLPDGTDAVAGNVEVFVADAMGNPTATSCLVVEGPVPACDTDNTADPAANAVPIQFNDNVDPLLIAAGAPAFTCGIDAVADLSSACGACNGPPACASFNAITVAAGCDVFDICIGYLDTDQDGIGDAGEDPAGITMTVDVGAASPAGDPPLNDGVFLFGGNAVGYCFTYVYAHPGCDPVPYTGLTELLCADGTPGVLDLTADGGPMVTLSPATDVVGAVFGIAGGGAFYPVLTAATTAAVCPTATDGSDGIAAFVTVTSPDGTVCATINGDMPACDTAGGNAAEVVQLNALADPLLTAIFGMDPLFPYFCTIDETADLSFDCGPCDQAPVCMNTVTIDMAVCNDQGTADPADDTYNITYTVTGNADATTWSSDQGDAGAAYPSTVVAMGVPAATGGMWVINVTDDTDANCTAMASTAIEPCSVAAICEDEISGTVTPPAGCDVSGIEVTVTAPDGTTIVLTTDANGVYDSSPTAYACGDYTVSLTANLPTCYTDANGETGPKTFTIDDDPANNDTDGEDFVPGVVMACEIEVIISNIVCNQGADPQDPADDTFTFDYTVNDIGGTGTTWSSDNGDAGVAYGTIISGNMAMPNSTFTINVNDDGDTACTSTDSAMFGDCATPAIPTLSQWGLMSLALLLMIFGAVKLSSVSLSTSRKK